MQRLLITSGCAVGAMQPGQQAQRTSGSACANAQRTIQPIRSCVPLHWQQALQPFPSSRHDDCHAHDHVQHRPSADHRRSTDGDDCHRRGQDDLAGHGEVLPRPAKH